MSESSAEAIIQAPAACFVRAWLARLPDAEKRLEAAYRETADLGTSTLWEALIEECRTAAAEVEWDFWMPFGAGGYVMRDALRGSYVPKEGR